MIGSTGSKPTKRYLDDGSRFGSVGLVLFVGALSQGFCERPWFGASFHFGGIMSTQSTEYDLHFSTGWQSLPTPASSIPRQSSTSQQSVAPQLSNSTKDQHQRSFADCDPTLRKGEEVRRARAGTHLYSDHRFDANPQRIENPRPRSLGIRAVGSFGMTDCPSRSQAP